MFVFLYDDMALQAPVLHDERAIADQVSRAGPVGKAIIFAAKGLDGGGVHREARCAGQNGEKVGRGIFKTYLQRVIIHR